VVRQIHHPRCVYVQCVNKHRLTFLEVYPISWEIFLDDVFLDGERLPRSTLSSPISPSALIDTVRISYRVVSQFLNWPTLRVTRSSVGLLMLSNQSTPDLVVRGFPVPLLIPWHSRLVVKCSLSILVILLAKLSWTL
jgi:hypothetical protein